MNGGFELVSFLHPENPPRRYLRATRVVNTDLHLIHVTTGGGVTELGGKQLRMHPGDVFFIEPYAEYAVRPDDRTGLDMINFHFHLNTVGGSSLARLRTLPTRFRPSDSASILKGLQRWYTAWETGDAFARAQVAGSLHQLALTYWSACGQEAHRPKAPIDEAMAQLARTLRNPATSAFDAEALAGDVYLSVSQINRRFRAAFDVAPKTYWLRYRYLLARARLLNTSNSVAQVATSLGFEDINYFSRWFKKAAGRSPRAFRTHARQTGQQPI